MTLRSFPRRNATNVPPFPCRDKLLICLRKGGINAHFNSTQEVSMTKRAERGCEFACVRCGVMFLMTMEHLRWFTIRNLIPPCRCSACRLARRIEKAAREAEEIQKLTRICRACQKPFVWTYEEQLVYSGTWCPGCHPIRRAEEARGIFPVAALLAKKS